MHLLVYPRLFAHEEIDQLFLTLIRASADARHLALLDEIRLRVLPERLAQLIGRRRGRGAGGARGRRKLHARAKMDKAFGCTAEEGSLYRSRTQRHRKLFVSTALYGTQRYLRVLKGHSRAT